MKKILCLLVVLFSFTMAHAQTDKTSRKNDASTEKKAKMTAQSKNEKTGKKQRDPVTIKPDGTDPATSASPASPGSNAATDTPLNAPSNMSNASPANNGTPAQGAPKR